MEFEWNFDVFYDFTSKMFDWFNSIWIMKILIHLKVFYIVNDDHHDINIQRYTIVQHIIIYFEPIFYIFSFTLQYIISYQ